MLQQRELRPSSAVLRKSSSGALLIVLEMMLMFPEQKGDLSAVLTLAQTS